MTEEELRVRLHLDASQLDSETRRSMANIANFGRESHKGFLHGDSAAKGFHKTIHEIAEQSPILGNALRLAISPIGGMFTVAAVAIGYATGKLEEFNKKLDEVAAKNRQSITSAPDKWGSFFRVRSEADKSNGGSGGGTQGHGELNPKAIEDNERLMEAKRKADELVKFRESEVAEKNKNITADEPTIWYKKLFRKMRGLKPGEQPKFDPLGLLTDDQAKSDSEYRELLEAKGKLQEAKNAASLIGGVQSETQKSIGQQSGNKAKGFGFSSMWNALGLGQSIGTSAVGAMQMTDILKRRQEYWNQVAAVTPTFDPSTGGWAYRGIDYHGIDYKPIKGAPGYTPTAPIKETKDSAELANQFFQQAQNQGVRVVIHDVDVP